MQLRGCNITRETLVKIESGKRHITIKELISLKEALNVTYEQIFDNLLVRRNNYGICICHFIHKIQDSDFTNMYGIKKPSGGGGQTYIQAAGYDFSELDRMFAESDIITDTLEFWDSEKIFPRKKYNFNAIAIGLNQSARNRISSKNRT